MGASHRIYPCVYTFRLRPGGVQLEHVPNPYSSPPGVPNSCSPKVSFGAEEDGWLLIPKEGPAELLRYEDGYWRSVGNPLPAELGSGLDICFPTVDEGWVSGWNGFAHYEDGTWTFVPGPRVWKLDFTARDDGWAISYDGSKNIYHYDGSSWSISYSAPGYRACGIGFSDRNNGWATFYTKPYGEDLWLKFDNGNWHKVIPPNEYVGSFPCPLSPTLAWFIGYENSNPDPVLTSWRWTTAPNVQPASLGRIKATFATEEEDDEEGAPTRRPPGGQKPLPEAGAGVIFSAVP